MIEIAAPSVEQIEACWPEISELLAKALDYSNGEIDLTTIKACIISKEVMLAVVFEDGKLIAAITFEQSVFPTGKRILNIQLAGGENMDSWFKEIDALATSLAKRYYCSDVYIIGRRGWLRQTKELGYSEIHTVMSKEVK